MTTLWLVEVVRGRHRSRSRSHTEMSTPSKRFPYLPEYLNQNPRIPKGAVHLPRNRRRQRPAGPDPRRLGQHEPPDRRRRLDGEGVPCLAPNHTRSVRRGGNEEEEEGDHDPLLYRGRQRQEPAHDPNPLRARCRARVPRRPLDDGVSRRLSQGARPPRGCEALGRREYRLARVADRARRCAGAGGEPGR